MSGPVAGGCDLNRSRTLGWTHVPAAQTAQVPGTESEIQRKPEIPGASIRPIRTGNDNLPAIVLHVESGPGLRDAVR